jgi:hypothetical protein
MMPDSLREAGKILERENQADLRLTVKGMLNYRGDDRVHLGARDLRTARDSNGCLEHGPQPVTTTLAASFGV